MGQTDRNRRHRFLERPFWRAESVSEAIVRLYARHWKRLGIAWCRRDLNAAWKRAGLPKWTTPLFAKTQQYASIPKVALPDYVSEGWYAAMAPDTAAVQEGLRALVVPTRQRGRGSGRRGYRSDPGRQSRAGGRILHRNPAN